MKNISQQKQKLRKEMLLLSQKQDVFCREAENRNFLERLRRLSVWKEASSVLLYASLPGEVDLLPLLEKQETPQKRFFFPRIEGEELEVYEWFSGAPWVIGPYNLREPDSKNLSSQSTDAVNNCVASLLESSSIFIYTPPLHHAASCSSLDSASLKTGSKAWRAALLEEIDLALVPGLAFDKKGGRLGRGGGFYDRLLSKSNCRCFKMGIAWPWQVVDEVPREPWDVEMEYLFKGTE